MSANMVLPLHQVLSDFAGPEIAERIYREAGLRYLPEPEEPVREKLVAEVHGAIRRAYPEDWKSIMTEAGEAAADIVATYRIPESAKTMLRRLPWPVATWMLMRSALQNAWTFSGSAEVSAPKTSSLKIDGNPAIRTHDSSEMVCAFQRALLQSLFRSIIHPRLECVETACEACGHDHCGFELRMAT